MRRLQSGRLQTSEQRPSLRSKTRKDKKEEGSLLRWKGDELRETRRQRMGSTSVGLSTALAHASYGPFPTSCSPPNSGQGHPGSPRTWSRLPGWSQDATSLNNLPSSLLQASGSQGPTQTSRERTGPLTPRAGAWGGESSSQGGASGATDPSLYSSDLKTNFDSTARLISGWGHEDCFHSEAHHQPVPTMERSHSLTALVTSCIDAVPTKAACRHSG